MSDKKKTASSAKKPAPRRRKQQGDENGLAFLIFFCLIVLCVVSWETGVMAAIGLLPTVVLAATGSGANKNLKFQVVAFINMIGVLMIAQQVYVNPAMFLPTLFNPISVALMWGCAGLGYVVVFMAPAFAAMVLQALSQDRLKKLNAQRNQVVEAWGSDVTRFD